MPLPTTIFIKRFTLKRRIPISSYPEERFNEELEADNVIELDLDFSIVREAYEEVEDILSEGFFEGQKESEKSGIRLFSLYPKWNGDMHWISSANDTAFDFFDEYFNKLGIAEKTKELLGDCGELIMYSGFFVVRSHTSSPYYHLDYSSEVGLNAFTLMTPIVETGEVGNLLYHDAYGDEQVYKYSRGTAVCFGGDFYHSTQPFESKEPYAFLCFTFGVNDMELWDHISDTAADQGLMYRHPTRGIVKVEG